jgi:hypothetical protein
MSNDKTAQSAETADRGKEGYATYILRCWTTRSNKLRVRLVDVSSGIQHPVHDVSLLPDLLRRLIAAQLPDKEE